MLNPVADQVWPESVSFPVLPDPCADPPLFDDIVSRNCRSSVTNITNLDANDRMSVPLATQIRRKTNRKVPTSDSKPPVRRMSGRMIQADSTLLQIAHVIFALSLNAELTLRTPNASTAVNSNAAPFAPA